MKWGPSAMAAIDSLENALRGEASKGIVNEETTPAITDALQRELTLRVKGKKASMLVELGEDEQVKKAMALLKTPQSYNQVLTAGVNEKK